MMLDSETIAAVASGYMDSGIGVIRVSGERALEIASALFFPANEKINIKSMRTYTAHYGWIKDSDKEELIDECVLLYMKGPHSYTGEDTVELSVHGGAYVCSRILQLILKKGARIAQPGEFTKRAFLNGRIDLTQAEAVMDIIRADNENALAMSANQLRGNLKEQIQNMRSLILHENAYIEYALDDPEHVSLDGFSSQLESKLNQLIQKIDFMLEHAREGMLVKDGIKTVIVGKPNAGKSSLLNSLLQQDRAIVTEIPGTTRDTLEERTVINGIPLNIIDTAGIRDTQNLVEKIGVDKTKKQIKEADLILYVVDSSKPLEEEDYSIIPLIQDKKVIILCNKSDLQEKIDKSNLKKLVNAPMISTSMIQNSGIDNFKQVLKDMFFSGTIKMNQEAGITNERQKSALYQAGESLKRVKESIDNGMSEDFYTIDLMDAYAYLGSIIGEAVEDDLVNEIFAEFCTGK